MPCSSWTCERTVHLLTKPQSHFTKELSEINAGILGGPPVDYDGVAEFWVESLEDWKKLWADEEFTATLEGES